MSELGPVVIRRTIDAPQDAVWQMLVDASKRDAWWPKATLEPEIGGEVSDESGVAGTVDVLVEGLTLGFRWRRSDEASERTAVIMLRPEDEDFSQTRITIIESGFATLSDAANAVREATDAWTARFDALRAEFSGEASTVDEGEHFEEPEAAGAEEQAADLVGEDTVTDEPMTDETVTDETVVDGDSPGQGRHEGTEPQPETGIAGVVTSANTVIEISEDDVIDAETYDPSQAILLPEVGGAPVTGSTVQISADLGVNEPVEVDETSEWERLLRGETPEA